MRQKAATGECLGIAVYDLLRLPLGGRLRHGRW